MRYRPGLLLPVLLLPFSSGSLALDVAPVPWLLQQVRTGEATNKYDLVTQSLYRLDKIAPDNPDVLAAKLRLALRQGDQARATQLMAELKQRAPNSAAARQAAAGMLLTTPGGRQQFQQARLLAASGRLEEALAAWDRLFHGDFPSGDIALEYWQLVARLPGQQVRALAAMQALDIQSPGNAGLQQSISQVKQNVDRSAADIRATALGVRGQALVQAGDRAAATAYFRQAVAAAPDGNDVSKWQSLLRSNQYWLLIEQGDKALAKGDVSTAERLYLRARPLDPRDGYAWIGLGDVALAHKDLDKAEPLYRDALRIDPGNTTALRRLAALYQQQSPQRALEFLNALPASQQRAMDEMLTRLRSRVFSDEADQLAQQRKWPQAVEKYRQAQQGAPDDVWLNYHYAGALRENGQTATADARMAAMARRQPHDPAQVYAYGLWLSGRGRDEAALKQLHTLPKAQWTADIQALSEQLERQRLLDNIDVHIAQHQPAAALTDYRQVMVASGITPQQPADDDTFTRLTRAQATDDWLKRGIRRDSADLYRQQDTIFTLEEDYSRNKGTGGVSDFTAHTTMLRAETPAGDGRRWLQLDNVDVSAGTFSRNLSGNISEDFGTCGNDDARCSHDFKQHQNGTSIGVGYRSERVSVDIGTTPLGFEVTNWVGGLTWNTRMDDIGVSLTASRRPIASSLLAFAGARDPNLASGKTWGGVIATGGAVGLSYDRGEAHGVWADISAHQLTGENVANNARERLMSGYYYKLINENNRRATVGLNGMLWHYDRDLSDYSLGQGGYYSPQRYASLSVPVTYRQRSENWSFDLSGSVSVSDSRTHPQPRYPLNFGELTLTRNNPPGSNGGGSGFGYTLQALVERRLSSHWTLGLGVDIQQAKDYTPSHGLMYLRYSMAGWQGDLDMPPQPLTPYADVK